MCRRFAEFDVDTLLGVAHYSWEASRPTVYRPSKSTVIIIHDYFHVKWKTLFEKVLLRYITLQFVWFYDVKYLLRPSSTVSYGRLRPKFFCDQFDRNTNFNELFQFFSAASGYRTNSKLIILFSLLGTQKQINVETDRLSTGKIDDNYSTWLFSC